MCKSDKTRGFGWVPTLYFAEGVPYVAVMTICTIMYKRMGAGNAEIAFFTSWLYLPWVIKPLWSPIVDIFSTKRRWIVVMQAAIAAGLAAVALSLSLPCWFAASLAAFWAVAFLSATHDIAADGFYMLALTESDQSFFVGIRTLFYRLALIAGQGGIVVLAGIWEYEWGVTAAWQWAFAGLSALFVLMAVYHYFVLPHALDDASPRGRQRISPVEALREFVMTFKTFFTKPGIVTALLFMLLYRFPEAQLIKLISPFLLDDAAAGGLGLTTSQVGIVYGTVGTIGLMAGGIIGGIVVSRGGLRRWLMPMAWSMSLTCLTFVYLSYGSDHSLAMVAACVLVEQLGYGFGGTAYTLYLIYFSSGPRRTSHYAMATGVMALGMMLPGLGAGKLEEAVGYGPFFLITMCCCLLTIGVASMVKVPADAGK